MKSDKKDGKIGRKLVLGMGGLGIALIIAIGLIIYYYSRSKVIERYQDVALSYTGIASLIIDGDVITDYAERLETDEFYEMVKDFLDASIQKANLVFYKVYVPYDEYKLIIWDGDDILGEGDEIGTQYPYSGNEKETIMSVFRGGSDETVLVHKVDGYGSVASAISPVYNSKGEPKAIVEGGFYLDDARESLTHIMSVATLIIVIVAGVLTIYQWIMIRMIVKPITELEKATETLVEDLKEGKPFEIDIKTGDEIERLADSFEKMNTELRVYIRENSEITAEKERIGTEIALAGRIQSDMLPGTFPAFPGHSEIDIYAVMTPARGIGGDFYDFFLLDENHLALCMADVSGKGIPAALFMMKSMIMIRNSAMSGNSPKKVLEEVNNELFRNNQERMFVTVWYGVLDLETGLLTASNGGHEYPVFMRPGQPFELYKDKHGFVLGGMENMRYTEYTVQMDPGSAVFVYTDGIPEATDKNNKLFGMKRTLEAVNRDPKAEPEKILENVNLAVADFVQDAVQFDDLTMMCVRYRGKQNGGTLS